VRRGDGVHVTIDRVVNALDGTVINYNPTTYDYRIATGRPGANECSRFLASCSADQLIGWYAKGSHPADGSAALVGRLVSIYGPDSGGRYSMSLTTLTPFRSYGDTGHGCGC
jgi:hypothetical protein